VTHYFVSLLSPLSLSPLSPRKKQNRKWPLLATSTSAIPSRKRPPGPRSGTNRNTRSQRVRRERKRQTGFVVRAATTTRAKKKLKLALATPPPPPKKKPEIGYRSHPREQPAPCEHRVSAKKEPSQRAEAALRAMGAVGPPLPPSSAAEAEDFAPPAAPSSAGTGVAERASEGIAGSTFKPGETFMGKEGGGK